MAGCCASKYAILEYQNGVRITVVGPIGVKTNFFNNRSFENHKPNYTVFMLETTTVSKGILAAANSTRLEIMVPFYARAGVWFKNTFPYVVNPAVDELFRREFGTVKKRS
jgi:short-subunit dehydrogenase